MKSTCKTLVALMELGLENVVFRLQIFASLLEAGYLEKTVDLPSL